MKLASDKQTYRGKVVPQTYQTPCAVCGCKDNEPLLQEHPEDPGYDTITSSGEKRRSSFQLGRDSRFQDEPKAPGWRVQPAGEPSELINLCAGCFATRCINPKLGWLPSRACRRSLAELRYLFKSHGPSRRWKNTEPRAWMLSVEPDSWPRVRVQRDVLSS